MLFHLRCAWELAIDCSVGMAYLINLSRVWALTMAWLADMACLIHQLYVKVFRIVLN